MAESTNERVQRLLQETGASNPPSTRTPEEVNQQLDQDLAYQLASGPERVAQRKAAFDKAGIPPPSAIAKPGTKELNTEGPVHKYVRPLLETGGLVGGGMIGAPVAPPYGAVAGGSLGYALGDAASSFLERMAGERPPVASLEQALSEAGRSVTGGSALELGARAVSRVAGKLVSKIASPFSEQYQGVNRTLDEMAQSKGITLDPHEVLQNRPLALGHKVLENIPFTSGVIQRKELGKLTALTTEWNRLREATGTKDRQRMGEIGQRIQDTIEKKLDQIGMRQGDIREQARDTILRDIGSPLTYRELGEQTQAAIIQHHQGLKDLENVAWDYARAGIPAGEVVQTNALKQEANSIKKDYENIPSFLDEPLLRQLNDVSGSGNKKYDALVTAANEQIPAGLPTEVRTKLLQEMTQGEKPGWSVDNLLKLRSELSNNIQAHHTGLQRGDATKGGADAYGRVYTRLLKAVDADLKAFGEKSGSDIADRFAMARAASGERLSFFNPKDHPAVTKAIMSDPATLANTLIKPGTAAGYTSLKQLVGNEAIQPVKQALTNQLMNVGGKEGEGLAGLRSRLDRLGSQTISEVYTPAEAQQLYDLANRANWSAHSPIGNPFFRELVKSAPSTVAPTILEHPDLTSKVIRQFPAMRASLRSAFVEGIKPNESAPFPTTMLKHLNAYPAEVQQQLFSRDEIKDFYNLAHIVDRTKSTVALAENPSGTAQNLVTFTTGGAVLKHPITMAPTVMTTQMIAKLYESKLGRKFLLEGLVTPIDSPKSVYLGTQILGVAGVDIGRDTATQRRQSQGIPLDTGSRLKQTP